jgi:hypothetical protein
LLQKNFSPVTMQEHARNLLQQDVHPLLEKSLEVA